jgi:hypothetical protein
VNIEVILSEFGEGCNCFDDVEDGVADIVADGVLVADGGFAGKEMISIALRKSAGLFVGVNQKLCASKYSFYSDPSYSSKYKL